MYVSRVDDNTLFINKQNVNSYSLEKLLKIYAKQGTVLEPNITLPSVFFSDEKQTAVKELKVAISSSVVSTEEYYHSMITELRKK